LFCMINVKTFNILILVRFFLIFKLVMFIYKYLIIIIIIILHYDHINIFSLGAQDHLSINIFGLKYF